MSVDAHCHLDLHPDPLSLLREAIDSRLQLVAVTTTPAAFRISVKFTDAAKGIIPALGMHPEVVAIRPRDIDLFNPYLEQVRWVGEVGLDGSKRFAGSWDAQVRVFNRILQECSNVGGRILSIHSRAAVQEVFKLLVKHPKCGTPVMHWFSGKPSEVTQGIELGAFFSVNLQMLDTKSGVEIIRKIPLSRLLTESDSPFSQPAYPAKIIDRIDLAEKRLADLYGTTQQCIKSTVATNFSSLTG